MQGRRTLVVPGFCLSTRVHSCHIASCAPIQPGCRCRPSLHKLYACSCVVSHLVPRPMCCRSYSSAHFLSDLFVSCHPLLHAGLDASGCRNVPQYVSIKSQDGTLLTFWSRCPEAPHPDSGARFPFADLPVCGLRPDAGPRGRTKSSFTLYKGGRVNGAVPSYWLVVSLILHRFSGSRYAHTSPACLLWSSLHVKASLENSKYTDSWPSGLSDGLSLVTRGQADAQGARENPDRGA